jgi:hypothetical protein
MIIATKELEELVGAAWAVVLSRTQRATYNAIDRLAAALEAWDKAQGSDTRSQGQYPGHKEDQHVVTEEAKRC